MNTSLASTSSIFFTLRISFLSVFGIEEDFSARFNELYLSSHERLNT